MDGQPSGPDFVIKVPFDIQPARDSLGVLEVRGKEVVFARELVEGRAGDDHRRRLQR